MCSFILDGELFEVTEDLFVETLAIFVEEKGE